jgi:hypothetical protein
VVAWLGLGEKLLELAAPASGHTSARPFLCEYFSNGYVSIGKWA